MRLKKPLKKKRPLGGINLKTALGPPSFHKQDKSVKAIQPSRKTPSPTSLQMWLWRITDKEKASGDEAGSPREQQTKEFHPKGHIKVTARRSPHFWGKDTQQPH